MEKKINLTLATAATILMPNFIQAAPQSKPNVIFILVDDMGWTDLGVYGSDFYQTPNIDKLANESIRFTNAYSACTVSSPTRASIMTGKYPAKLHLTDWIEGWKSGDRILQIPDWTMYLPQKEVTMAELFKNANYSTIHIGKWHLGNDEMYWPEHQGFDINIGGWAKGSPNRNEKEDLNGYFSPYGNPRLKDGKDGEYLTERLTDEACSFLDNQSQSTPFFLNMWFYNVHTPLQAKQDKIDRYTALVDNNKRHNNPVYAAMVEHVDDAVGKIVDKLKSKGLYDNTIIVFTSDNGGLIGKTNRVTNNYPLRAGKGTKYEGGVRVPLFIKSVKENHKGSVNNTPVMSIDLLPTIMDMANIKIPKSIKKELDGISLKPLLNNRPLKRDELYWHYPHYHSQGATPYSAIRKGDWKLIHTIEGNRYELYNLKTDLGESNDVSISNPQIVAKLRKTLEKWKKDMKAQMPIRK